MNDPIMQEAANNFIDVAKEELRLVGLLETEFGKSALDFLEKTFLYANGDPKVIGLLINNITFLSKRKPISALTEDELVECTGLNGGPSLRNKRYPSVCKENDGKFYDDEAITFINKNGDKLFVYQGGLSSRQEISFPYFPVETIVKLDD